jgi:hypothetical protein
MTVITFPFRKLSFDGFDAPAKAVLELYDKRRHVVAVALQIAGLSSLDLKMRLIDVDVADIDVLREALKSDASAFCDLAEMLLTVEARLEAMRRGLI